MTGYVLCISLPEGKIAETQYTLVQTSDKRHTCRGSKHFTQRLREAERWRYKLYRKLPRASEIDACQAFSGMLFQLSYRAKDWMSF